MKQNATLDASFWVHAVFANLVDRLLDDFALTITDDVLKELPDTYPSGKRLRDLVKADRVKVQNPKSAAVKQFSAGERSAMNLVAEQTDCTLLIDDLRPYRAAEAMGLSIVSTPAFAVSLYRRKILNRKETLEVLDLLAARATLGHSLIDPALAQMRAVEEDQ